MKSLLLLRVALLVVAAVSTGCQSTRAARIREHAALFATLDPFTQKVVSDGLFNYGFTPELLYMSLGKPNRVETSDGDRGHVEIWVYRNFLYGNEGAVKIGGATPGLRNKDAAVISSSAPGGPSLMSTKASPSQATLTDVNDVELGTLCIELVNGVLVSARVLK